MLRASLTTSYYIPGWQLGAEDAQEDAINAPPKAAGPADVEAPSIGAVSAVSVSSEEEPLSGESASTPTPPSGPPTREATASRDTLCATGRFAGRLADGGISGTFRCSREHKRCTIETTNKPTRLRLRQKLTARSKQMDAILHDEDSGLAALRACFLPQLEHPAYGAAVDKLRYLQLVFKQCGGDLSVASRWLVARGTSMLTPQQALDLARLELNYPQVEPSPNKPRVSSREAP